MPDRFDHDPVARLEAAKAAHRSMFDGDPTPGPRTTAIEDVLIAQLVEARAERDRYEAALMADPDLLFDLAIEAGWVPPTVATADLSHVQEIAARLDDFDD